MDVGGHGDCYSPAERGESGRRGEGESSGAPGFDGSVRVQECVPDAGRSLKKKRGRPGPCGAQPVGQEAGR